MKHGLQQSQEQKEQRGKSGTDRWGVSERGSRLHLRDAHSYVRAFSQRKGRMMRRFAGRTTRRSASRCPARGCWRGCVSNGFTIVELLVVISIISILAALLLPSVRSAHKLALSSSCCNNLRGVGMGLSNYADSFNGFQLPSYVGDPNVNSSWWIYRLPAYAGTPSFYEAGSCLACPDQSNRTAFAMNYYTGSILANGQPGTETSYLGRLSTLRTPSTSYYVADGNLSGDSSRWSLRMYPYPEDSWKAGRLMDLTRHPGGANVVSPDNHVATTSLPLSLLNSATADYRRYWLFK